ncbi:hypothetical protein BDU57DRAFT_545273 [Ampelomyces quisqualis]|uniref:Uncharacterized protein n=1 Tax=Ampelomyces quisqualis TaxID=50730 RepID=A0A6A5R539_AMPQU|nr:hypothetical protein BDU57DRAFT_545273 [Ampelomyces quisqualis]
MARPVIIINKDFQAFPRTQVRFSNTDEHYRILLGFASALVHEFAHAYNFWFNPGGVEPRWTRSEKEAELGWSWERTMLGYGVQLMRPFSGREGMRNRFLFDFKMLEYRSSNERKHVVAELVASHRTDAQFTTADARGRIAAPLAMPTNRFNYSSYYLDDDANVDSYIAAAQVVTMGWVIAWFSEEMWQARSEIWRHEDRYIRPSAGNGFVLLYECSGRYARTLRPLFPAFPVDSDILRRRARGDYSRWTLQATYMINSLNSHDCFVSNVSRP